MLGKVVILATAAMLAAPIGAATGGGGSGGGSTTAGAGGGGGAGAGGHGGGGGGSGAGHGGGAVAGSANGGGGRSGGLSGRAAAATARSGMDRHVVGLRAGISHTDAMHATHLAGGKHAEGEHTNSKSPGMDHHRHHPYRREPDYGAGIDQLIPACLTSNDLTSRAWFDCNAPAKSRPGHKS